MHNVEKIISRLQDILEKEKEEKIFLKDVAKELGMSSSQLSNFKNRNSVPYEQIASYCAQKRISINWVLYGQPISMLHSDTEDIYKIRYINDVCSSAGGGAINEEDENITYLTIDPVFVDTLGIGGRKSIEAVKVVGDSMEPTISDSAIIIIDRDKIQLVDGGIYVLNSPSGVIVKRISININGMIDLISDNTIHPVQSISGEELSVLGRVVGVLEKI